MFALKLMSIVLMAIYGIGTIESSGTFIWTIRPPWMNWKDT